MRKYDYTINVYYGEKFICTLGANHAGGYDNIIYWQLGELIKGYNNKDITAELFENTVEDLSDYFFVLSTDQPIVNSDIIDFKNKVLSKPTDVIYEIDEFNETWDGYCALVKENDKYYVDYYENEKYELEKVEFDNINLLYKNILTFEEFNILNKFYTELMDKNVEFLLNNSKIIKFNYI